jgi:hypothetical protein
MESWVVQARTIPRSCAARAVSRGSARGASACHCRAVRRGMPVARLRRRPTGPMAAMASASLSRNRAGDPSHAPPGATLVCAFNGSTEYAIACTSTSAQARAFLQVLRTFTVSNLFAPGAWHRVAGQTHPRIGRSSASSPASTNSRIRAADETMPSQSCQDIEAAGGTVPGNSSSSPGSPFNEPGINSANGGIRGQHYNETSQYDVACFQVSQQH